METGRIARWMEAKGFGFVEPDSGKEDLFVHISEIAGRQSPNVGDKVRYEVGDNRGRFCAVNVELV